MSDNPAWKGPTTESRLERLEAICRVHQLHEPSCAVVRASLFAASPEGEGVYVSAPPCDCWLAPPVVVDVTAPDSHPVRHVHFHGTTPRVHDHVGGDRVHDHAGDSQPDSSPGGHFRKSLP